MRTLSVRQKKELMRLYNESGVKSCDDMTHDQYRRVSNLNLHENFDSNADRFLMDLHFATPSTYAPFN